MCFAVSSPQRLTRLRNKLPDKPFDVWKIVRYSLCGRLLSMHFPHVWTPGVNVVKATFYPGGSGIKYAEQGLYVFLNKPTRTLRTTRVFHNDFRGTRYVLLKLRASKKDLVAMSCKYDDDYDGPIGLFNKLRLTKAQHENALKR